MGYTTIDTRLLERVASGIEDADIANILGISLNHDLSDLPKLNRIWDYRKNFVNSLIEDLNGLEKSMSMIRVAEDVVRTSVDNDVQMRVGYNALNTQFGDAGLDVKVESSPEGVTFYVIANRLVGRKGWGALIGQDLEYLQKVFVDPSTIPLDSVDGLTIVRDGSPIIKPLRETQGLPRILGEQMKATHALQIQYSATIPTGMLAAVYEMHNNR